MLIICFEDEQVEKLAPIIHARPAYAISCGSFRLLDWLVELQATNSQSKIAGCIREYLRPIQAIDFPLDDMPETLAASSAAKDGVLLVNARCVPSESTYDALSSLASAGQVAVVRDSDDCVLAAWLPPGSVSEADSQPGGEPIAQWHNEAITKLMRFVESSDDVALDGLQLDAFGWPHHVVAHHMTIMAAAANYRVKHGDYREIQDGVFAKAGVSIGDFASIDTSDSPIVLDENVKVGPFCYLEGPLYAGANTRVIEHSSIKDGVCLGHTTKIGGEVEASVIEPYTNKQHHGFLGHSYLGSWINLGAGTCNSDLKNTYGKINVTYGNEKVATGMQFVGAIIGDYSKSAINTGIFTGKIIGVCSMMYGFVTSNVPSYVNYARLFGQTSLLPPKVMISTQQRMFARRKVEQRQCDMDLVRAMHARTESERQASDELSF